jgi:hypothetical protein
MIIAVPRDHTHAGVYYRKGMMVDLPEAAIAWLIHAEQVTRAALVTEQAAVNIPEPEPVAEPAEPEPEAETE